MATVNFLYRSTKPKAMLTARLLFRHNNSDFAIDANSKYETTKEYWSKEHKKNTKDAELKTKQVDINKGLNKIENHILTEFSKTKTELITKEWLFNVIELYYNPPVPIEALPTELIKYTQKYIEIKKNEITANTIKKCNVIKQLLVRFELHFKTTLYVTDVNSNFKTNFETYCLSNKYAPNTIATALKFIKVICNHAKHNGLEISYQLDNIKIKNTKVENVYLTIDELDLISSIEDAKLTDSLKNARDWLIISCYTGQRVSDFMRFTSEQIRVENGKNLIEFTQKKTGKIMTVPLHKKVIEILEKRNGNFPYSISDQKYNTYIKKVCEIAEIDQLVNGSKILETEPKSKIFRKETKLFKKFELVTSHIGRRSFATNFYGTIPTSLLIGATGHSTEAMFLNYIGKSDTQKANQLADYF
ncbi:MULTISPECIES: tyrosine-type recombinase/integrase [unclassified Flavobacterium]|uniref:tyrosine-type recombinase/integrase n=1 Tax=unclassified Flavobacterium TaxID=196869 RepID=UPI00131D0C69|nr:MULTISPECIES: tyrosine-type recombinase/integrase [unclassified Flavobacterium]